MRRVLAWVFLLSSTVVFSQDIHFSQFYMSPTNLNPAMTGVMNCKMRFIANYRNQWAPILKQNSFSTYNLSFDQKVPVGRYDYFGFGGTFWGDKAGTLDFSTIQFKLSGAYSKRMSGTRTSANYLVFGAEAGVNQRSVNFQNAIWGNQIDPNSGPNTQNPSFEPNIDDAFLFADVAIGAMWFSVLDKKNNFYLGTAYSHINEPDVRFYENNQAFPLPPKTTVHGGGVFAAGRKMSIIPGFVMFSQSTSFQVNAGTSFRWNLAKSRGDTQDFQLGLWGRISNKTEGVWADAVIVSTRFDYDKFGVGLSYDINTSDLRRASAANNAFELSLIYNICGPEKRGIYCPNF